MKDGKHKLVSSNELATELMYVQFQVDAHDLCELHIHAYYDAHTSTWRVDISRQERPNE